MNSRFGLFVGLLLFGTVNAGLRGFEDSNVPEVGSERFHGESESANVDRDQIEKDSPIEGEVMGFLDDPNFLALDNDDVGNPRQAKQMKKRDAKGNRKEQEKIDNRKAIVDKMQVGNQVEVEYFKDHMYPASVNGENKDGVIIEWGKRHAPETYPINKVQPSLAETMISKFKQANPGLYIRNLVNILNHDDLIIEDINIDDSQGRSIQDIVSFELVDRWSYPIMDPLVAVSVVNKNRGSHLYRDGPDSVGIVFDPERVRFLMGCDTDMDSVVLKRLEDEEKRKKNCPKLHDYCGEEAIKGKGWSRECWEEHLAKWKSIGGQKLKSMINAQIIGSHYSKIVFNVTEMKLQKWQAPAKGTTFVHNEALIWQKHGADWVKDAILGLYVHPVLGEMLNKEPDELDEDELCHIQKFLKVFYHKTLSNRAIISRKKHDFHNIYEVHANQDLLNRAKEKDCNKVEPLMYPPGLVAI